MMFLLLLLILLSNGVFGSANRLQNNLVTTFQRYKFEGIDVTEMPKGFFDWQNDCYGYYFRCIRHTPLMWVCGFNLKSWKFGAYPNECIIELINCQQEKKNQKPVFGEWIYGKLNLGEVFYNGENKDCEAYTRRSQDIEHIVHMYFARNEELKQLIR